MLIFGRIRIYRAIFSIRIPYTPPLYKAIYIYSNVIKSSIGGPNCP